MRRIAMLVTVAAMAAVPTAASAAGDQDAVLQRYNDLLIQLRDCNLDVNWGQMSEERRADCDNLFRDYVLFADATQSETYYVHCRSASTCIQTPDGKPTASGPIPQGSTVYDVKPRGTGTSAKAAAHKKRHRHHHS
jgi:hypothetical protein